MNDDGIDHDAQAYLAFLDAQPQTAKNKKAGVQGYCMGGALSFRTAAAVPRPHRGGGQFPWRQRAGDQGAPTARIC